jgi:hypothetical protein
VSFGVQIAPEAEADMVEAFDWYENRRAGLGEEFMDDEVRSALRLIANTVSKRRMLAHETFPLQSALPDSRR